VEKNGNNIELVLSVLSSITQEESRSISEKIRWSVQKKFRQAKVTVTTKRFLKNEKIKVVRQNG